jgi:hypothetical protein
MLPVVTFPPLTVLQAQRSLTKVSRFQALEVGE